MQEILGLDRPELVDRFLAEMLPPLLEMERQVVEGQLADNSPVMQYVRNRPTPPGPLDAEIMEKYRVLTERRRDLAQQTQILEPFIRERVNGNRHVYRFGYGN
jgi:hypothetical protein